MESLRAAYTDNDDDEIEQLSTQNGVVILDTINGIKDEPHTPASSSLNPNHNNNSPKLPPHETDETDEEEEEEEEDDDEEEDEADDDDEEEEEEESPNPKKHISESPKPEPSSDIQITDMPSSPADPIPPMNGKVSKKKSKKKKSKDVWVTTSRKGKKKTKHDHASKEDDKVLITLIPRFPDRNDDSPDLKICLSKVYKAEKVEVSEDRLSAGSTKGYRMVRATRGVSQGAWYFEIKVVHLGETGHTRLGWSTEKADVQAPVGYDGNSYSYRDIDGSKVHKALRDKYGEEGYKEGDVIGFYINLPDGGSYAPNLSRLIWYKGQPGVCAPNAKEDPPKPVPGSEITFYKNGICQGIAFKDLLGGRYYPAASMYTLPNQSNCVVKFNFGPDFERFPDDFGERPVPRPMIEVPYQSYDARVENGTPWNITRMCPMLKVMKEDGKIAKAYEMGD